MAVIKRFLKTGKENCEAYTVFYECPNNQRVGIKEGLSSVFEQVLETFLVWVGVCFHSRLGGRRRNAMAGKESRDGLKLCQKPHPGRCLGCRLTARRRGVNAFRTMPVTFSKKWLFHVSISKDQALCLICSTWLLIRCPRRGRVVHPHAGSEGYQAKRLTSNYTSCLFMWQPVSSFLQVALINRCNC